ncbi:MAG: hypothetical protein AB1424_08490 [Thermodesulfobacteriota bacterium]
MWGGYLGASLVPSTDLKFNDGIFPAGGTVNTSKQKFEPAVVGGLEFGYFLKSVPYLGLEAETNYAHNNVREQRVTLNRAVQGTVQRGTAHFDYDSHRIVLGVAYHF